MFGTLCAVYNIKFAYVSRPLVICRPPQIPEVIYYTTKRCYHLFMMKDM